MTAELPLGEILNQVVQQFGLGPYDSSEEDEHGEDSNAHIPKKSLPDGGGPCSPDVETLTSYPTAPAPTAFASVRLEGFSAFDPAYEVWLRQKAEELRTTTGGLNLYPYGSTPEYRALAMEIRGTAEIPGDFDRPPVSRRPADDVIGPGVQPVSNSQLPNDGGNPAARSDYYDRMRQGLDRAPDPAASGLWADDDKGAYASDVETLPTEPKNETEMDNSLGALGNAWSGRVVDEQAGAQAFPSTDYLEDVNYPRSDRDGGGYTMASGHRRVSTNIGLVEEMTDALVKRFGKKDLTRRHVMAFLKEAGRSQYFASDIIRCLKLSHKVYVKDVLDEFPVTKTASSTPATPTLATTRDALIDLEVHHMADLGTAKELRRCAASLSDVIAKVERMAGDPRHDYDDYAPAHGHAEDSSARDAYKDYCEDREDPVSFEEFLEGKH